MRSKKSPRLTKWMGVMAVTVPVIGIVAAVMLTAAHQRSQPANMKGLGTQAEKAATQAEAKKAALAPVAGAAAAKTHGVNATAGDALAVESPTTASVSKATPVTITGCLGRADEAFRLTDTSGADAPKSRSWKTAFLKKGSASLELVNPTNGLKLPNHVGQRVSVTGILVDHEMRVRSLRRVAASCGNSPRARI